MCVCVCSVLCYSSDRQLSLDLVNVGRQRLDFLPMLEHSGTYRESPAHTGTFAQEIITLVHHVKGLGAGVEGWRAFLTTNTRDSGCVDVCVCRALLWREGPHPERTLLQGQVLRGRGGGEADSEPAVQLQPVRHLWAVLPLLLVTDLRSFWVCLSPQRLRCEGAG